MKNMKKEYEAPRAEKMNFNYTEAVVASSCKGGSQEICTENGYGCNSNHTGQYTALEGTSSMNV